MATDGALSPGLTGKAERLVEAAQSAAHVGSGSIEVFATPMMIALMEAAAVDCVERLLPPGCVSLGTHVAVSHAAATPIGARVSATARLEAVEGRTLRFCVEARDARGPIGDGTHTRVVVEKSRFLAKLGSG